MCDVSRLDSYKIMNISTRKNYQVSTSFYVRILKFYARWVDKSPVRCYARFTHNTLAHYLQIHYTFYMDSVQILKPNKTLIYI